MYLEEMAETIEKNSDNFAFHIVGDGSLKQKLVDRNFKSVFFYDFVEREYILEIVKAADFAFLGLFNKILGGVFNLLFSAFIVSVIFMFFNQWNTTQYVISNEKKENSNLYAPVAALAPLLLRDFVEDLKNIDVQKEILNINQSEKKE